MTVVMKGLKVPDKSAFARLFVQVKRRILLAKVADQRVADFRKPNFRLCENWLRLKFPATPTPIFLSISNNSHHLLTSIYDNGKILLWLLSLLS